MYSYIAILLQIKQIRLQSSKHIAEDDLLNTILLIREKRQLQCSDIRKKYLIKRTLMEIVDLMVAKEPTENEMKGRSSGSLSWRQQRGEEEISNNVGLLTLFYLHSYMKS